MAELGVGWISIKPDVSHITPGVAKALQGTEVAADKSGKSIGGKLASGIGNTLKIGGAAAGVAAGAAVAMGMTKGLGRLQGIENAQAKLSGLGHSASGVSSIMEDALASVKGTAFGLEDAATIAASAVAAGVKPGEDLQRTLKLTGDAATIAGVELNEMGSIVNKVATSDMMQMDVANQLMDAGIPILQMVAAEMGVTAEEARKLASDGKISFETFQTALEKGLGGAALESGKTVEGAFRNMGAAAGRLGATIQGPFFRQAAAGFGGVTSLLDNLDAAAKPVMARFETWLSGPGINGLRDFGGAVQEAFSSFSQSSQVTSLVDQTVKGFVALGGAAKALVPPVLNIGEALGKASTALGLSVWQVFTNTLRLTADAANLVAPPLTAISGFLADHPALVTAAVAAWAAFKTVPAITERLHSSLERGSSALGNFRSGMGTLAPAMSNLATWSKESGNEMSKLDIYMQALGDTGTGMGQKLAQSYNNASAPLKQFAQTQRDAGYDAMTAAMLSGNSWDSADKQISAAGHRVSASVASMAGTVKGVGAAAFTGLKGAATGVMNLFGGPWGVALAGATFFLNSVATASNKAKSAQEEIQAAADDSADAYVALNAAVAGTTGALSEEGLTAATRVAKNELAEFTAQGEALSGWMWKVGGDTSIWDRILNNEKWQEAKTSARETRAAYKELESAAEELGVPMSQLDAIVAEGGKEFYELITHLNGTGEAGERAARELVGVRTEITQAINDARNLDPAISAARDAIETLADSASTADDKLGALNTVLQAMGLAPKDAERAMRDAAEAVDQVSDSIDNSDPSFSGLGDALLNAEGRFDTTSEAGRYFFDTLDGLSRELQTVAANGGDVNGIYEEMVPQIDRLREQSGLSAEAFDGLVRSMGLVPDVLVTQVGIEGADVAQQQLQTIATQVETIPPGKSFQFEALTDDAYNALYSMGYQIDTIPGSKNVKITAPTEEAQLQLSTLTSRMNELGGLQVSPTILLNTTPLEGSAAHSRGILDTLAIQKPTPEADIIIKKLQSGVDISQGELDFLAAQTPTPTADLDKRLLEHGVNVSDGMLRQLHAQRPEPVLDADGRPLFAAVDSSKAKLNELQNKTVDIRIREWREYYSTGSNTSSGGTSVGQHYGATGRRFAGGGMPRHEGYRLPKTGPGTQQVDGFMAFDSDHAPLARLDAGEWVINGRMSERYNRELAQINAGTFPKLPGFATGGQILDFARGKSVNGQRASRSLEGAPYVWGGVNWGDCSGAMAGLARFAVGMSAFAGRFATMNEESALRSMGFKNGLGGPNDFSIGWFNGGPYGGHTSGTVSGVNVEMGGGRGNGQIGGGAAPASHSQYTHRAHLPLTPPKPVKVGESYTEWKTPGSDNTTTSPGLQWQGSNLTSTQMASAESKMGAAGTVTEKPDAAETAKAGTSTKNDAPTSWSEVAGIAAAEFASGQVKDMLGVFGIPDSPPLLKAYAMYANDNANNPNVSTTPEGMAAVFAAAMKTVVGDVPAPAKVPDAVYQVMNDVFRGAGIRIPGFKTGGTVRGKSGEDQILARLTDQEFVVNANDAERTRPLLEHINKGGKVGTSTRRGNTYNIYGVDAGDVIRQIQAKELASTMQHLGG